MAKQEKAQLPGTTSTVYRQSIQALPEDLKDSPNLQRVMSPSLYEAVVSAGSEISEKGVIPSEEQIAEIANFVLGEIEQLGNSYHGRVHTEQVMECCEILATAAGLEKHDAVVLKLAALMHDFDHAGESLRQTVPNVVRNDLSNEEFAAIKADEQYRELLGVRERLEIQEIILGSTFGQSNPDALPDLSGVSLQRDYSPFSKLGRMLALADVGRCMLGVEAHIEGSFMLLRESGGTQDSFTDWLKGEQGFLGFVQMRFDDVKPELEAGAAAEIQGKLDEVRAFLEEASRESSDLYFGMQKRFEEIQSES